MLSNLIHIRELDFTSKSEMNFIYDSWMKSYFRPSQLDEHIYNKYQSQVIFKLLESSKVYVASSTSDHSQILGYLVTNGNHCHYYFTKYSFRRMGVMKALFEHCNITKDSECSHKSYKNLTKYNPYLLIEGLK